MGLFSKLFPFGKCEAPLLEKPNHFLAFVLLRFDEFPASDTIIAAFAKYAQGHHTISIATDENAAPADDAEKDVVMMTVEGIGTAFVALMPRPIPHGEAEAAFPMSISSFAENNRLEDHRAHLVVSLMPEAEIDVVEGMMAFTSLLAALVDAAQAVGVYFGNARATHTKEFFLTMAEEYDVSPRILLWNGVSRSPEANGKMSFLSHGMHQIALPDLYLICDERDAGEAMGRMFDLLAYIASRRQAIRAGDTIGATAEEKIRVQYVKSPADPKQIVWKVEM